MERIDRASRVIAAPPATVYRALLEPESLEAWLPPEGMSGRVEQWDPRPGGGFRMVLTYLDPSDSPGKTSDATDVVEVEFAALAPPERVVQRAVFEADDPSYAGTMTMTWHLTAMGEQTDVTALRLTYHPASTRRSMRPRSPPRWPTSRPTSKPPTNFEVGADRTSAKSRFAQPDHSRCPAWIIGAPIRVTSGRPPGERRSVGVGRFAQGDLGIREEISYVRSNSALRRSD